MNKTQIEWCKNPDGTQGYTWNPITGCLNHVDGMCKGGNFPCYAYRLANTRLKERYLANKNYVGVGNQLVDSMQDASLSHFPPNLNPFYPRFWEDRLEDLPLGIDDPKYQLAIRKKARGIFVCDMADLFGIGVPERWTQEVLDRVEDYSFHRFYLLTKQPETLIKFSPFPDNAQVGVTLTAGKGDYVQLYPKMYQLKKIQAKLKYISFEPLLDRVDLPNIPMLEKGLKECGVGWVIIGSQTKPYKPPKIEWVREIVTACDKAGIPVFLKDNLKPLVLDNANKLYGHWTDEGHWKLRQELPE